MKILSIKNPFGAPVYYEETVSSTFDVARVLAAGNEVHGTVITADFQEAGRGRQGRPWAAERGKSLLFTILLRYDNFSSIPGLLTLRTGYSVSLAVEDMIPDLAGLIKIKWPNDIMITHKKGEAAFKKAEAAFKKAEAAFKKAAGILTETDGKLVYIGVGFNVAQAEFQEDYCSGAVSLEQVSPGLCDGARFILLEKILSRLYEEIEKEKEAGQLHGGGHLPSEEWREALCKRLYKMNETVTFANGAASTADAVGAVGAAGSGQLIEGTLSGIGKGGELLIIPCGEKTERAFVTGELRVY